MEVRPLCRHQCATEEMSEMQLARVDDDQPLHLGQQSRLFRGAVVEYEKRDQAATRHAVTEGTARQQHMVQLALRDEQNIYEGRLQVRHRAVLRHLGQVAQEALNVEREHSTEDHPQLSDKMSRLETCFFRMPAWNFLPRTCSLDKFQQPVPSRHESCYWLHKKSWQTNSPCEYEQ